jgi:hypothetical protein
MMSAKRAKRTASNIGSYRLSSTTKGNVMVKTLLRRWSANRITKSASITYLGEGDTAQLRKTYVQIVMRGLAAQKGLQRANSMYLYKAIGSDHEKNEVAAALDNI